MIDDSPIELWRKSAQAWIRMQQDAGDGARRGVLDPALLRLLPDVKGLSVLDVGCGEGRYCRALADRGARVTGIDPVEEFIAQAREQHPQGQYEVSPAETLPFEDAKFDLVLSYLTMVDIPDDVAAAREMVRVLRPGGRIVIVTVSNMASTTDGWARDEAGRKLYRTVDRYMEHFAMDLAWGGIEIVNYHRPLSHCLGIFLSQRMVLTQFVEPLPDPSSPEYPDEFRCPNFQIYEFQSAL